MSAAKEDLIRAIRELPEGSSREEIVRELANQFLVESAGGESDADRTISNEELARRVRPWRK